MSQGAFSVSNNGAYTTNYTNDSTFYFIGQGTFTGPPDWTQVQTTITNTTDVGGVISVIGTSTWTVAGTGGSGKILSIKLVTDTNEFNNKTVEIILQTGGGTFTSGTGNIFNPPSPPCFAEGTRILINSGYKAVQNLSQTDRVMTSDNRAVPFKLMKFTISETTKDTAPYRILPGAFGKNVPSATLCLSPRHMVQYRKNVWISPRIAAQNNNRIEQYGVGMPVTYYHIMCENFLQDNLIAEGTIVESFGTMEAIKGRSDTYKWNTTLGGFTRLGYKSLFNSNKKIDLEKILKE